MIFPSDQSHSCTEEMLLGNGTEIMKNQNIKEDW